MREDLLNELVTKAELNYLSDLHEVIYFSQISYALNFLSPEIYTLEEWEAAISYVLGREKLTFSSVSSAVNFLQGELDKAIAESRKKL